MTDYTFIPGKATHNAKVAMALWRRESIWVDEDNGAIFASSSSGDSAGITTFDELVEIITDFDHVGLLSPSDVRAAAAMIFHLAPTMTYEDAETAIAG